MRNPFSAGIPQAKSVVGNLAAIASVALAASVVNAWADGDFVDWSMFPHLMEHASIFAVVCMCGWIFLKSPWAPAARELMSSLQARQTTTDPRTQQTTVTDVHSETTKPIDPKPAA